MLKYLDIGSRINELIDSSNISAKVMAVYAGKRNQIGDTGAMALSKLEILDASNNNIGTQGIVALLKSSTLVSLNLRNYPELDYLFEIYKRYFNHDFICDNFGEKTENQVTDEAMRSLLENNVLQKLDIGGNKKITENTLYALAANFNLQEIKTDFFGIMKTEHIRPIVFAYCENNPIVRANNARAKNIVTAVPSLKLLSLFAVAVSKNKLPCPDIFAANLKNLKKVDDFISNPKRTMNAFS